MIESIMMLSMMYFLNESAPPGNSASTSTVSKIGAFVVSVEIEFGTCENEKKLVNEKKRSKMNFILQTYKCLTLRHAGARSEIDWKMVSSFT